MSGFEGNYERHFEALAFFIKAAVESIKELNKAHVKNDIIEVMFALSYVITAVNNSGVHIRDLFTFHKNEMSKEDKFHIDEWMKYVEDEVKPKIEKDLNVIREFLLEMQRRDIQVVKKDVPDMLDQLLKALQKKPDGNSNGRPGNGKPGNGKPGSKKDFSVNEW